MAKYIITGANRGIGLAMTEVLLKQGDLVFACCRRPEQATQLQALAAATPGSIHIVALDVDDDVSIAAAVKSISAQTDSVDYLLNNAGIGSGPEQLDSLSREHLQRFFNTNSTSPLMVALACMPLLRHAEKGWIINFSSILGSIGSEAPGVEWSSFAYRASKAALNMINRTLATHLASCNVSTICIHPGWVQTDMGGPNAPLTPASAALTILNTVARLQPAQSGGYIDLHGAVLPW